MTIDDHAKDGGYEAIYSLILCSFYYDPLQPMLLYLVSYEADIHKLASNGLIGLLSY